MSIQQINLRNIFSFTRYDQNYDTSGRRLTEFTVDNTDQQKHQEMLMVIERPRHISFILPLGSGRKGKKVSYTESTASEQSVVMELWDRGSGQKAGIAPRKEGRLPNFCHRESHASE